MKLKYLKLSCILLALAFGVGIFFTVRTIMTKHKVVNVHKVINKETGEEVTVFDDPEFEDYLDDVLGDLDNDWDEEDFVNDEPLPEEDEIVIEDDLVIPDGPANVTYATENPVKGSPVAESDTTRDINISLSEVAYENYMSTGGNSFSELTSDVAVQKGFDSVDWEFQKYFYYKLNGAYSRLPFNMDGMITDTYGGQDPVRAGLVSNLNENQDYLNYTGQGGIDGKSHVYSFDNDQMASFFRMLNTHYEQGTEVWLNTGWKVASRIQSWYGASSARPHNGAPYDIKSFVVANITLLLECESRYPGTVKYLAFGNEAANGEDFANDGDIIRYTRCLYTAMKAALDFYPELEGIQLCAGEDAQAAYIDRDQKYMTLGGKLKEEGILDGYSIHHYYKMADGCRTYDSMYERLCFSKETAKGGVYVNETGWFSYDDPEYYSSETTYSGNWWDYTAASFQVLAANTGTKGGNTWSYGSMFWPHTSTLGELSDDESTAGIGLFGTGKQLQTCTMYYTVAMMQNYIPAHSDVMKVTWEGEDLRVTAFRLSDGNYTFLVEANASDLEERQLNFKLDGALNKELYRISYSETTDELAEGLVPMSESSWTQKVGSSFTDTINEDYCTYIYTTKKPIGQLKANNQKVTAAAGNLAELEVTGIDCEVEKVEWEILASAGTQAEDVYTQYKYNDDVIQSTGKLKAKYAPSPSASSGDRIAVKAQATLKDGSKTYTVIQITIE